MALIFPWQQIAFILKQWLMLLCSNVFIIVSIALIKLPLCEHGLCESATKIQELTIICAFRNYYYIKIFADFSFIENEYIFISTFISHNGFYINGFSSNFLNILCTCSSACDTVSFKSSSIFVDYFYSVVFLFDSFSCNLFQILLFSQEKTSILLNDLTVFLVRQNK